MFRYIKCMPVFNCGHLHTSQNHIYCPLEKYWNDKGNLYIYVSYIHTCSADYSFGKPFLYK